MDLPKPEATASKRRSYSEDFKRDAVRLIVEEGYSFKAASVAVDVSGQTLRSWLAPKPKPCGDDATISELQAEVKQLRKTLKRTEMEREILKKATAALSLINRASRSRNALLLKTGRLDSRAPRLVSYCPDVPSAKSLPFGLLQFGWPRGFTACRS